MESQIINLFIKASNPDPNKGRDFLFLLPIVTIFVNFPNKNFAVPKFLLIFAAFKFSYAAEKSLVMCQLFLCPMTLLLVITI